MAHQQTDSPSLLSLEFTKRMRQLGFSRRELERRSGLSRQTLFKIENEGRTELRRDTYATLDEYLMWVPGTALALAQGNVKAAGEADILVQVDRESAYRWRIVERIHSMSLEELETMVALMEANTLGEAPITTARHLELMEERISALNESSVGTSDGEPQWQHTSSENQRT